VNINTFLIKQIREWMHISHFKLLSKKKKIKLQKIAKAFNIDI
jgi:hypothetical protein